MRTFIVHESQLTRQTIKWKVQAESETEAVDKMYEGEIADIDTEEVYESDVLEVEEVTDH